MLVVLYLSVFYLGGGAHSTLIAELLTFPAPVMTGFPSGTVVVVQKSETIVTIVHGNGNA